MDPPVSVGQTRAGRARVGGTAGLFGTGDSRQAVGPWRESSEIPVLEGGEQFHPGGLGVRLGLA